MRDQAESENPEKKAARDLLNGMMRGISLSANFDNLTAAGGQALKKLADVSPFIAIGEIGCSITSLLLSAGFVFKMRKDDRFNLPSIWVGLVSISNVLSLIGGSILASADSRQCDETDTKTIVGLACIGLSKIFHPLVTGFMDEKLKPEGTSETAISSLR